MAIQPIDLQTLYGQLEKIGKSQVQQQAAMQAAREAEMQTNKDKAAQNLNSVQTSEAGDEKTGRVHDRNESAGQQGGGEASLPAKKKEETPPENEKEIVKDPALGHHIDISG
jgi:hypothetical protein